MQKLAALDAILDTTCPEAAPTFYAELCEQRSKTAIALAETRPLGARVAAARKQLQKARSQLAAAEARALAAAEEAEAAQRKAQEAKEEAEQYLVHESSAASELDMLEKQVTAQKGGVHAALHAQALMKTVDHWLTREGVTAPQEVQHAAEALRGALEGVPGPPEDDNATDLEESRATDDSGAPPAAPPATPASTDVGGSAAAAPTSDAPSASGPGSGEATTGDGVSTDENMAGAKHEDFQVHESRRTKKQKKGERSRSRLVKTRK